MQFQITDWQIFVDPFFLFIYLELDFNYMKLMTYRKMQLDSTLQKSFLIRIMHRIYNTTTLPHCNNASQTGKPNK